MTDLLKESINRQFDNYYKGLITYSEMLDSIIRIAEDEKPRLIEYKNGKRGKWLLFDDIIYTKQEAQEYVDRLNQHNTMGLTFRARA